MKTEFLLFSIGPMMGHHTSFRDADGSSHADIFTGTIGEDCGIFGRGVTVQYDVDLEEGCLFRTMKLPTVDLMFNNPVRELNIYKMFLF